MSPSVIAPLIQILLLCAGPGQQIGEDAAGGGRGGQDHAGDEFEDFLEQTDPHFKLGAGGQEAGGQVVRTIASVQDLSQHYPGTADGHLAADQLDPADTEERGGDDHAWVKVGRKVWM